jgi:hypothetical protein
MSNKVMPLTIKQHDAARILGVSPFVLRKLIKSGRLRAIRYHALQVHDKPDSVLKTRCRVSYKDLVKIIDEIYSGDASLIYSIKRRAEFVSRKTTGDGWVGYGDVKNSPTLEAEARAAGLKSHLDPMRFVGGVIPDWYKAGGTNGKDN